MLLVRAVHTDRKDALTLKQIMPSGFQLGRWWTEFLVNWVGDDGAIGKRLKVIGQNVLFIADSILKRC